MHRHSSIVGTLNRKDGKLKFTVRQGCEADAAEAIEVVRKSISELCIADHQGDARVVADWLSNKSEAAWQTWLTRRDATVLVAEKMNEIVGVGMIDHEGEVLLNYVRPDARFCGVSKALLSALESVAANKGVALCVLESTRTAKTFYERCGYRSADKASQRLTKPIAKAAIG